MIERIVALELKWYGEKQIINAVRDIALSMPREFPYDIDPWDFIWSMRAGETPIIAYDIDYGAFLQTCRGCSRLWIFGYDIVKEYKRNELQHFIDDVRKRADKMFSHERKAVVLDLHGSGWKRAYDVMSAIGNIPYSIKEKPFPLNDMLDRVGSGYDIVIVYDVYRGVIFPVLKEVHELLSTRSFSVIRTYNIEDADDFIFDVGGRPSTSYGRRETVYEYRRRWEHLSAFSDFASKQTKKKEL